METGKWPNSYLNSAPVFKCAAGDFKISLTNRYKFPVKCLINRGSRWLQILVCTAYLEVAHPGNWVFIK